MNKGLLTLLLLLLGCSKRAPPEVEPPKEPEAPHVHEEAHEELPTRVALSDAVVADAQIRTAKVTRAVVPLTLGLPGELVANPDKSARLASPIAGRIEEVRFQEGSEVTKGEVLAVIRVPDLGKLRSARVGALAKAKAARSDARRLKELVDQQLAPQQAYYDALASAEALEIEARAAADQLAALGLTDQHKNLSALTLRAPFSGVVVSRHAVVGQPVTADEVLCEIVDLSELWFLGRVFEKDLGQLRLDAPAEVQLNAYPQQRFEGVVAYIGQQVDPVARTVTARIALRNRDGLLRIGLFGTAYVSIDEPSAREPRLVVPRSALTEVAGKTVLFVRHADGHFELHEVVLGASAAGQVEILSGLREGEQVVVEGAFTLKSAVLKSTFVEEE